MIERIDLLLKHPRYFFYLSENSNREQKRRYCRHDWQHMRDVARIAYILAMEEKVLLGRDIIYAAGLLHDIGRWKEYDTGEDHAVVSAVLAREILDCAGYSGIECELILRAIQEHRRVSSGSSPLGQLICRADDLSRPCLMCDVKADCYKSNKMETAKYFLVY
jgi:putative nucleotidyltransferase with HDIG domain